MRLCGVLACSAKPPPSHGVCAATMDGPLAAMTTSTLLLAPVTRPDTGSVGEQTGDTVGAAVKPVEGVAVPLSVGELVGVGVLPKLLLLLDDGVAEPVVEAEGLDEREMVGGLDGEGCVYVQRRL